MKIIYNDTVLDGDKLNISAICNGFNFGEGFFTTIKTINKKPQNLNLHINRIKNSLNFFDFDIKLPEIEDLINILLKDNNLVDGRFKMTFFKDLTGISYILYCEKLTFIKTEHDLFISKYIRGNSPVFRYKSLNYYSNLKSPHTIFVDHKNRLLETGFANIFLIFNNMIYTPPLSLPILPGTYREYLLSIKIPGYNLMEKELFEYDIKNCDGMFITNSIRGIEAVKSIDGYNIPTNLVEKLNGNIQK